MSKELNVEKPKQCYGGKYIDENGVFQFSLGARVCDNKIVFSILDTHDNIVEFNMTYNLFRDFCKLLISLADRLPNE